MHGNADKLGNKAANQYVTKDRYATITGSMTLDANTQSNLESDIQQQTLKKIDFPTGFNKDNCVCIALGMRIDTNKNYSYGTSSSISNQAVSGSFPRHVVLGAADDNTKISLQVWQSATSKKTVYYKIVLMRTD